LAINSATLARVDIAKKFKFLSYLLFLFYSSCFDLVI
jgi:hypothetical protein